MKSIRKAFIAAFIALAAFSADAQNNSGNIGATILTSAARTATPVNTTDQTNVAYSSAHIIINVSAYTAGNYTPHVQAKDPVSGTYYDILVGTAISATGITILKIGPGIGAIANGSAQDFLPKTWRVSMVGAGGQSMTFSIGAFLLAE